MELTAPVRSQKSIATWDSARDAWILPPERNMPLIFERSDVYSETFPTSGSMRNGVVYEHPTLAHHTNDSGSLFSQPGEMLPTPAASVANDGEGTETWLARRERVKLTASNGNGMGMPLTIAVQLLPTPEAKLATSGPDYARAGREKSGGHDLATAAHLLPTPKAGDADFGMPRTSGRPPEKSTHLMTRMVHTLPTPRATRGGSNTEIAHLAGGERSDEHRAQGVVEVPESASWGPYAAAIERWVMVLGRAAPEPTEAGPKGGRRLSARFVEWLMGLPDGWLTDPEIGLSRTEQLRALGNGVVEQQATFALQLMHSHERNTP